MESRNTQNVAASHASRNKTSSLSTTTPTTNAPLNTSTTTVTTGQKRAGQQHSVAVSVPASTTVSPARSGVAMLPSSGVPRMDLLDAVLIPSSIQPTKPSKAATNINDGLKYI